MKNLIYFATALLSLTGIQFPLIAAPTHRPIAKADEAQHYNVSISVTDRSMAKEQLKLTLADQATTYNNQTAWNDPLLGVRNLKSGVYTATITLLSMGDIPNTNPTTFSSIIQEVTVFSSNGTVRILSVGNYSIPDPFRFVLMPNEETELAWEWGADRKLETSQTKDWLAQHTIYHIGDTCKIVFWVGSHHSKTIASPDHGCSITPLTTITDPVALRFENGDNIDTDHLTPQMQTSLAMFRQKISEAGGHVVLTSAYRPPAYQAHLREVYDKWQELKDKHEPGCQELRSQVKAEFLKHGLKKQRPASSAGPHTQGLAIDLGMDRMGLPREKILEIAKECGLYLRTDLPNDRFHFQHL